MSEQKSQQVFEAEDFEQAKHYDVLGPAYFAARRMAEQVMRGSDAEPFKQAVDVAAKAIREALYDYAEGHLLSDLECNIQGHIERVVNATVEALLTGQQWALDRYPLSKRYDADRVRVAIVAHAGAALRDAYVSDLETQVAQLNKDVVRMREWQR